MSSPLSNAFDILRSSIKNINLYQSPYEHPKAGTITDEFGSIEFVNSESITVSKQARVNTSWILKSISRYSVDIYGIPTYSSYINFRYGNTVKNVTLDTDIMAMVGMTGYIKIGVIYAPYTFIFPKRYRGSPIFYVDSSSFGRGIYLNSSGSNIASSEEWIANTYSIDSTRADVVVDFDSGYKLTPFYLNRLYLASKTFNNLANKLGTVTNGKLYLGSKNIANMTSTQKSAITAKGWTIY